MQSWIQLVGSECKRILRNPARLRAALHPRRWRQFFDMLAFNLRSGNRWRSNPAEPAFQNRAYADYSDYVRHQRSKLQYLDLAEYEAEFRDRLRERLAQDGLVRRGSSVLCLGARLGAEVRAFQDHGCFAVGLDLNPGPRNPVVLPGDFHAIPFPDASVDVIFTNSLDHVFDLEKVMGEIRRALKPGGTLVIEAVEGRQQGTLPDAYASFAWSNTDDLVARFERAGFRLLHRRPFADRWPGEHICFEKTT